MFTLSYKQKYFKYFWLCIFFEVFCWGTTFSKYFLKPLSTNLKSARPFLGSNQHFLQTLKGLSHEMDLAFKDMHGQL
jgi:hypothetical protein